MFFAAGGWGGINKVHYDLTENGNEGYIELEY